MGQERFGVQIDRMAAGRPHDRNPGIAALLPQVFGAANPIAKVPLVEHLIEAGGDRLQVTAGEAPVGGESLGEDQQIAALGGQLGILQCQEPTDVGDGVLLGREGDPIHE